MILRAIAVAAVVFVAGCAATSQSVNVAEPAAFERHILNVSSIDRWDIRARLAFHSGKKGGSGTLVWKRDRDQHAIDLFGTFGDNRIRITQDEYGAVLTNSKGDRIEGRTADELLYIQTGWILPPIHEFDDWIVGSLSTDVATDFKWNRHGYVTSFEQSGWKVRCYDYREVGRYALPAQVRAASRNYDPVGRSFHDHGEDTPVEVKLSIHSWGVQ